MIRNILFDMGQVLIRFDRDYFMTRLGISPEDKQLLMREVFLSVEWVQMDRGSICEDQAYLQISMWDRPILPIEGMYELIEELKGKGYGIYLLSNASLRQHEYWPRIPASRFFDGTIISADEKVMKPHPDYYHRAMEKFHLIPEECFFIDDVPANIEGALYCGIPGAVFHGDVALLRQQLAAAGVAVSQ